MDTMRLLINTYATHNHLTRPKISDRYREGAWPEVKVN